MDKTSEINLTFEGVEPLELLGENNLKLNLLRKAYPDVQITSRGNVLKLVGEKKNTQEVKAKFESMVRYLKEHQELTAHTV
ncbi:MAG TPA: phosphate starvation-inducible protein PhoH, partial [Saprospiraceae bacterium]|nr:phosphate starvation-inducible protein PhoH [Saprospiraceae bacterium]